VTGAVPLAIFIAECVIAILTLELQREIGEGDAVLLLGVALSFLNLAN